MTTLHDFHISGGIVPFEMEIDEPADRSQEGATLKLRRDRGKALAPLTVDWWLPDELVPMFLGVLKSRRIQHFESAMLALSTWGKATGTTWVEEPAFMEAAE